tara:strand:+ start:1969 stop:2115 length:147 start_codon:yes stop_codon:yes gene_type:complete
MVDIVSLLSIASCSIVSIIAQIQNSRCKKIKACGVQCDREVSNDNDDD